MSKSILVYGAGSIGSFLAAKLYNAENKVDVVGNLKRFEKIKGKIFINETVFKFPEVKTDFDLNKYYDYIFVTSKYNDLKRNLEYIVNSGVRYNTIVLIQNTFIDNIWYYHLIKDKPLVIISIYEGYNLHDNKIEVSEATGWFVENDLLGKDVYILLKKAGINISLADDIRIKRAEKTIQNCALNGLCAYYGITFDKLVLEHKSELKNIFFETYDILSEIVPLRSKKTLWKNFIDVSKNMKHYASTYQDVKKNKKTELVFLNGFIVELGNKLNISTPFNLEVIKKFKEKYPNLY